MSVREVPFGRSSEARASLFRPIDEAHCVRFVTPASRRSSEAPASLRGACERSWCFATPMSLASLRDRNSVIAALGAGSRAGTAAILFGTRPALANPCRSGREFPVLAGSRCSHAEGAARTPIENRTPTTENQLQCPVASWRPWPPRIADGVSSTIEAAVLPLWQSGGGGSGGHLPE